MRQNVQYLKYFSKSRFVWTKFKLLIIRCIYSDGRAREIHRKDITELSSLTCISFELSLQPETESQISVHDRPRQVTEAGTWGPEEDRHREAETTRYEADTGGQSSSSGAHLTCDQ